MQKSIRIVAQELKDLITKGDNFQAPDLSNFAVQYTTNTTLKNEGLNLELDFFNLQNDELKEKMKPTLLAFIDRVANEYRQDEETVYEASLKNDKQKAQFEQNKIAKDNSAIVFEGESIGKTYQSSRFRLENIDLTLRIGEITGVVGENGNGKTTLFQICVGNLQHDTGRIRYPDLKMDTWNTIDWYQAKQNIVFIPQELPKWQGNLVDNLRLEAAMHGFRGKVNEENVKFAIERFDLEPHASKKWAELSGGYKLRFALAKALVCKPRLLVIDEPLANLDINAQTIILNDLKDLVESRIFPLSVMISSQHLHEIERIAHNLVFLKEGKLLYGGKTEDFGSERDENCFELECNLTIQVFEQRLKTSGFEYNSVRHNGLVLIVSTPLHITERELLQFMLSQDIKMGYMRNISQSIKKYFV